MNINKLKSERGFTIVELLIVIVVIAILAAITIVAFNGVQQRARDSERASDVSNITKALSTYIADGNTVPADGDAAATALGAYDTVSVGTETLNKLEETNTGTPASNGNDTTYGYQTCGGTPATGAHISYEKEAGGTPATETMTAGSC